MPVARSRKRERVEQGNGSGRDLATGLPAHSKPSRRAVLLAAVLLVAAVVVAYWPVFGLGFTSFDDDRYVTANPNIAPGLNVKTAAWAFTHAHAANWHPLTWMSHMLDRSLFGLQPTGHHAVSLALHVLNTLLLFLALAKLTKSVWRGAFVAALFGIHPIHVESVAWVAERKDVLSTFFWMLTMLAYAHYAERPCARRYALVFLSLTLGLMAKPMLVTLPIVLLLLDFWPLQRLRETAKRVPVPRLILEKVPLFALATASCVVTVIVQRTAGAVTRLEHIPLGIRVANTLVSYVSYIEKTLWPARLAAYYPHPMGSLPEWAVAGAVVVLVACTVVAIRLARRAPYLTFGWLWYLVTLVPVIGIVQVGEQAMADRYSYVPLIGIFIMVAWGVPELWNRKPSSATRRTRRRAAVSRLSRPETGSFSVPSAVGCVLVMILMSLTWKQVGYWKDDYTLFAHALDVTSRNYMAHDHVGSALLDRGDYEGALEHQTEAVRIKPDFAVAQCNLGNTLSKLGRLREAASHLETATKLSPNFAEAHYNLGNVLYSLGDMDRAKHHLLAALRVDPKLAQARCCYGAVLYAQGSVDKAIKQLLEAVRLKPDYPVSHLNLGIIYLRQGRVDDAIAELNTARRLRPTDADSCRWLAAAYERKGDPGKAREYAELYRKAGNP